MHHKVLNPHYSFIYMNIALITVKTIDTGGFITQIQGGLVGFREGKMIF